MAFGLSVEQSERLATAVEDLRAQTDAESVFLADHGGNLIASTGSGGEARLQNIAALGAGAFSATREMAALVGEPTFHSVFHQGERNSIYIRSVEPGFLLLVVFGRRTAAGSGVAPCAR